MVVDETQNETTVILTHSANLVIELATRPGTGYAWQLLEVPQDILRLVNQETLTPARTGDRLLAGESKQRFHFKSVSSGQGAVLLGYRRAWEKEADDLKRFSLQVTVRKH